MVGLAGMAIEIGRVGQGRLWPMGEVSTGRICYQPGYKFWFMLGTQLYGESYKVKQTNKHFSWQYINILSVITMDRASGPASNMIRIF